MAINFYTTDTGIDYIVDNGTIELEEDFELEKYLEVIDYHFKLVMNYLHTCYKKGTEIYVGSNPHKGERDDMDNMD